MPSRPGSTIQSLLFSRTVGGPRRKGWTKSTAQQWCKSNNYPCPNTAMDITDAYVHVRLRDSKDFRKAGFGPSDKGGKMRTIDLGTFKKHGIRARVGVPKPSKR